MRLDLVLHAIRLCPAEFVSTASLFPEVDLLLKGIGDAGPRDGLSSDLAKDAAAKIKAYPSLTDSAIAERLVVALGKPTLTSPGALLRVQQRDSRALSKMAVDQKDRSGDKQNVLLTGLFIMWIVNRQALNAAFQETPSAEEWLRPYYPSYMLVGAVGEEAQAYEELAAAIVSRASQNRGPVDRWFRGFKIEHQP